MAHGKIGFLLSAFLLPLTAAQNHVEICHGTDSIVIAVIATLIVTLGLLATGFFFYKSYWRSKKGNHLMLVTDAENPNDQYAFDNPCFREATPCKQNISEEKQASRLEKNKWLGWNSLNPFGKDQKTEKVTSLDDSYVNESRLKVVTLKSHDFTGLGFNIYGNMRDGIFVKDILHRGPAFESGCINSGDRIDSVCISFRNMVFEDALTILSYASPYDVQVQVENDSHSRPSTLIRSKRESNAISSAEKIQHPKYSRSQSISHLNEIGKSSNKRTPHRIDFMHEKNRINQSLNKSHEGSNDYPTIKLSPTTNKSKREFQKLENNSVSMVSPVPEVERSTAASESHISDSRKSADPRSKLRKFGIKVLPLGSNAIESTDLKCENSREQPKTAIVFENEIGSKCERGEKSANLKTLPDMTSRSTSPAQDPVKNGRTDHREETDGSRENVKGILAKGFQNLKEKINQNTLGRRKTKDTIADENVGNESSKKSGQKPNEKPTESANGKNPCPTDTAQGDCPVPKRRSSVTSEVKGNDNNKQNGISVPEEVSRAGDVARNNRKSLNDPNFSRKSTASLITDVKRESETNLADGKGETAGKKTDNLSDSENSVDGDSTRNSDGIKRPKRSKGKAPAPPGPDIPNDDKPQAISRKRSHETVRTKTYESDGKKNESEPERPEVSNDDEEGDSDKNRISRYDSDSDVEPTSFDSTDKANNRKIELNANQVTVHQSSSGDGNDDDVEQGRKAASLGDLSRLDSEQPLSVVLERAVSLDLADGSSQAAKKRKAPLPPPEEFPAVFDENSLGLNTFQRRLKKSSDFGRLEDVLGDGPKSLEIDINQRNSPVDLTETNNYNIQEFSSWLAECRRPKSSRSDNSGDEPISSRISSTSFVSVNNCDEEIGTENGETRFDCPGNDTGFSVNGKNLADFRTVSQEGRNGSASSGNNSRSTVVLISQPNSLEPVRMEAVPANVAKGESDTGSSKDVEEIERLPSAAGKGDDLRSIEPCVKAVESGLESFDDEVPPKLPTSPIPIATASSTLYSPLSSSFTYITEVKLSTSGHQENEGKGSSESPTRNGTDETFNESNSELKMSTPKREDANSMSKRIQMFDGNASLSKPFVTPVKTKSGFGTNFAGQGGDTGSWKKERNHESSKIPIKTMKSETGQKIMATIQSLATRETSPPKIPEVEYAKRVASLFSGNSLERNRKKTEIETDRSTVSGFYLKGPETSKGNVSTKKIPPTVPPRKTETALSSKSSVTVDVTGKNHETDSVANQKGGDNDKMAASQDANIVTFTSFMPKSSNDESSNSTLISFKIK